MKSLIASDEEIIALRASVTEAAKAQLQNGVLSANDFLKEVNDEDQARQTLVTHQVRLLQAQINYQIISENNKSSFMKSSTLLIITFIFSLIACDNSKHQFDASGTFEVDEVIVSAEVAGKYYR